MAARDSLPRVAREVIACELCPRLRAHCRRIAVEKRRAFRDETYWGSPVPAFGDPDARIVLVGLAPGAHGSNRTGRMFTGDASGEWLYAALHQAGLASGPVSVSREDGMRLRGAWITAAARCAPPGNRPTPDEIARCRPYLVRELRLLRRARVLLCLGRIGWDATFLALEELGQPRPRPRPLFRHGAETSVSPGPEFPGGLTVLASYHPSRQNTNTGRLTRAMLDAILARANRIVA